MAWQALGAVAGQIAQNFLNRDNADFSSASQYKYQLKLNKSNFKYNKKLIDYQNAFNEHMYNRSVEQANSAHQREVEDLRKAGLNPILSATGGNGATTVSPVTSGNSQLSSSAGMPSVENPDLMNAYATHNQVQIDKRRVAYEEHNAHSLRNLQATQSDLNSSQTQKTTLEGDYQKILNDNLQTQIDYQNKNSALELKKGQAEIDAILHDIVRQDNESQERIKNYRSQTKLNESNSAKAYDDIKNRPITTGETLRVGPLTFGYQHTGVGSSTNSSGQTTAAKQFEKSHPTVTNKKSPIWNPNYGAYR